MMKIFGLIRRRDDLSSTAFMRYWRDVHAPMGAAVAGIEGYVLSEVLAPPSIAETAASFDGVAEFWFDGPASRRAMLASPQSPAWFADTLNFVRGQKSFLAEEILPARSGVGPPSTIKALVLLDRLPGGGAAEIAREIGRSADVSAWALWEILDEMTRPDLPPVEVRRPWAIAELWSADSDTAQAAAQMLIAAPFSGTAYIVCEHVVKSRRVQS